MFCLYFITYFLSFCAQLTNYTGLCSLPQKKPEKGFSYGYTWSFIAIKGFKPHPTSKIKTVCDHSLPKINLNTAKG